MNGERKENYVTNGIVEGMGVRGEGVSKSARPNADFGCATSERSGVYFYSGATHTPRGQPFTEATRIRITVKLTLSICIRSHIDTLYYPQSTAQK